MKRFYIAAGAVLLCSTTAFAQTQPAELRVSDLQAKAQVQAETAAAPKPAATMKALPASTIVNVTPREEISSKHIEEGHKVIFTVVEDVIQDGVVVIPRGTPVQATIPWKTGRAIGGKSGKFDVTFDSVAVGGKSYKMSGKHRQEGRGNTVGALLGSIFISGRSAVMLPGQIVTAFTDQPIPFPAS